MVVEGGFILLESLRYGLEPQSNSREILKV